MRKILIALAAAAGFGLFAAPVNAAIQQTPVEQSEKTQTRTEKPVQEARVYCHRNGVFLHWGPCAQDRWRYRPVYRPYYRPVYRPYYRPYYRQYRPYRPYYRYRRW